MSCYVYHKCKQFKQFEWLRMHSVKPHTRLFLNTQEDSTCFTFSDTNLQPFVYTIFTYYNTTSDLFEIAFTAYQTKLLLQTYVILKQTYWYEKHSGQTASILYTVIVLTRHCILLVSNKINRTVSQTILHTVQLLKNSTYVPYTCDKKIYLQDTSWRGTTARTKI